MRRFIDINCRLILMREFNFRCSSHSHIVGRSESDSRRDRGRVEVQFQFSVTLSSGLARSTHTRRDRPSTVKRSGSD